MAELDTRIPLMVTPPRRGRTGGHPAPWERAQQFQLRDLARRQGAQELAEQGQLRDLYRRYAGGDEPAAGGAAPLSSMATPQAGMPAPAAGAPQAPAQGGIGSEGFLRELAQISPELYRQERAAQQQGTTEGLKQAKTLTEIGEKQQDQRIKTLQTLREITDDGITRLTACLNAPPDQQQACYEQAKADRKATLQRMPLPDDLKQQAVAEVDSYPAQFDPAWAEQQMRGAVGLKDQLDMAWRETEAQMRLDMEQRKLRERSGLEARKLQETTRHHRATEQRQAREKQIKPEEAVRRITRLRDMERKILAGEPVDLSEAATQWLDDLKAKTLQGDVSAATDPQATAEEAAAARQRAVQGIRAAIHYYAQFTPESYREQAGLAGGATGGATITNIRRVR